MNWGCWYLHAINCHQLAFFIQHEGAWGRTGSTVHRIKVWVAGIIHDTLGPHLVHKILKFCWTQHFPLVVLSFSDGFPMVWMARLWGPVLCPYAHFAASLLPKLRSVSLLTAAGPGYWDAAFKAHGGTAQQLVETIAKLGTGLDTGNWWEEL